MADFLVTALTDVVDDNDTVLTLREAITLANNSIGPDRIEFDPGLAGGTLTLVNGTLRITGDETTIDGDIDGDDTADITIDGNGADTVFEIDEIDDFPPPPEGNPVSATLNGLVI